MRCTSCSAPMPHSGIICQYCGTRNDIDLRDKKIKVLNERPMQNRECPLCHIDMPTVNVGEKTPFYVERCSSCYGIFFDINELEMMIESSVTGSRNVDLARLSELTQHPRHIDIVLYKKCPVCQKRMSRENYLAKSGVITDVCLKHGVWLDSGELRQILEWVKLGGVNRAEARLKQRAEVKLKERAKEAKSRSALPYEWKRDREYEAPTLLEILYDTLMFGRW